MNQMGSYHEQGQDEISTLTHSLGSVWEMVSGCYAPSPSQMRAELHLLSLYFTSILTLLQLLLL